MAIVVTPKTANANAWLLRFAQAFSPAAVDLIAERTAARTLTALVSNTPKKWTGMTRRSWQMLRGVGGGWQVTNISKIMVFLELGTRDHGPVTAKMLFLPLTRAAAIGGWNPGLVRGQDYILRKEVRGIQAMGIVKKQIPITRGWLREDAVKFVTNALK